MDATTPSASEEQDQIQTQLNMHLAITIPVIMEIGSITAQVELKNVTWIASDSKSLQLRFDIHRSGKKSSYGDFTLTHRSADGKMTQVGLVKGVAVYAPIKKTKLFSSSHYSGRCDNKRRGIDSGIYLANQAQRNIGFLGGSS